MKSRKIKVLAIALLPAIVAQAYETPTMGWSSWNTYGFQISEKIIQSQADAIVSTGLSDAGFKYINIDDGFFGGRDADGHLLIHPTRFPNGLRPLVDYIHAKGLKAGIYSDAGHNTCASFHGGDKIGEGVGLYEHDQEDMDLYFKTLDFDFIKVDFCGGDPIHNNENLDLSEKERYTEIHQAMVNTGRSDLRLNVCRWAFPGTWVHDVATSWRISEDIYMGWNSVKGIIAQNLYLSAYATEGKFNDMDMLEVGRGLTDEEDKTHFGMWCIMSSPLLIGCDMTSIPAKALALMKNKELIALNQDPLALQAYVASSSNGTYVLVKDVEQLYGNKRAIALYNPTDTEQAITANFTTLDLGGTVSVRDVYAQEDLGTWQGSMTVRVPAHGTRIYVLTAEKRYEQSHYEGEVAWLDAYQELENNQAAKTGIYENSAVASGGVLAGWLGCSEKNDLQWRNVYSREGGKYEMTLSYISGVDRNIKVEVNGEEVKTITVNSGDWNKVAQVTLSVTLEKGNNIIRLSNAADWMPNIDCMSLVKEGSLDVYQRNLDGALAEARQLLTTELPARLNIQLEQVIADAAQVEATQESYEKITALVRAAIDDVCMGCDSYDTFQAMASQYQENINISKDCEALLAFKQKLTTEIQNVEQAQDSRTIGVALESIKNAFTAYFNDPETMPREGEKWDMTSYVTNPQFITNADGWIGSPTVRDQVGEFWNTGFNVYQVITGLKNGHYIVKMNALYRNGANDSGAAYKAGTEVIKGEVYAGNTTQPIVSLYEHPQGAEEVFVGTDLKNGYINSMHAAYVLFGRGMYENELPVEVTDGTLKIGLKSNNTTYDCWCCFDNVRLYFVGNKVSAVEKVAGDDNTKDKVDVYTLAGVKVKTAVLRANALDGLARGTYVVDGEKIIK